MPKKTMKDLLRRAKEVYGDRVLIKDRRKSRPVAKNPLSRKILICVVEQGFPNIKIYEPTIEEAFRALNRIKGSTRKLTFMLDENEIKKMSAEHVKSPMQKHSEGMGRHYPPQQSVVKTLDLLEHIRWPSKIKETRNMSRRKGDKGI